MCCLPEDVLAEHIVRSWVGLTSVHVLPRCPAHAALSMPLQARIHEAMSKSSIQDLEASLQAASDAYVQATNTKRLFRDVIIEDDYNPLAPLARSIRVPTADLQDPLLHDLIKTQTEKNLLQTGISSKSNTFGPGSSTGGRQSPGGSASGRQGRTGSSRASSRGQPGQLSNRQDGPSSSSTAFGLAKATTRPMLETQRWGAGQINATPYGHCIDDRTAQYIVK